MQPDGMPLSRPRPARASNSLSGTGASPRSSARAGDYHPRLSQSDPATPPDARTSGAATPLAGAGATPRQPAPRPAARAGSVYRGLPWPVQVLSWAALAVVVGAVLGSTAPTAIGRIGAVAAIQPGLLAWYSVRALGFLAYLVLAGAVLYGLLLSTRILDAIAHRPVSFALHKDLSIAALVLASLHGTLLIFDQSFSFTPLAILVPFELPYSPLTVGVGQLTLYASAVVTASFYVRRHIGQKTWRLIHYVTFLAFVGASFHGIASGSDSGSAWAFWIYLAPVTAAVFLTTYRIVVTVSTRAKQPRDRRTGVRVPAPDGRGPLDRPGAARESLP